METNVNNKRDDYYACLGVAQSFEQFWCEIINYKLHLNLTRIKAQENQSKFLCDTKEGFEFKHNTAIDTYKSVFIEISQKMKREDKDFMHSSISKKDNAWMYCIGDFKRLYLVPKKHLISEYESGGYKIIPNTKGTGMGFKIPITRLEEISVLKLTPINKETEHSLAARIKSLKTGDPYEK